MPLKLIVEGQPAAERGETGILWLFWLGSVVGLVFGLVALRQIVTIIADMAKGLQTVPTAHKPDGILSAAHTRPGRDGCKPDDTHFAGADLYTDSVVPLAGHDWITRPFRALVRLSVLRSQVYDLGVAVYQSRVRGPP